MDENLLEKFCDKNVMITGGLGFIGSNLAYKLVELKANVLIVDALIPNYGGNLFNVETIKDKVKINFSDVRDKSSINYLVKNQHYIFNLAGQVSHIDSMEDPVTDLEINCCAQLSLLEACRKNNKEVKIIFAGTRQQYGKPRYLPVDEMHLMQPLDVNGINKIAGEWYHILYNNIYGIRASSLRLTNTYGPRILMKHNRQGFIGWFVRQAIDGETIKIFGDGKQIRDLNYVDDVVMAFLLAAADERTNGEVFNLGSDESVSLLELVKTLLEITGTSNYEIIPFPEEKKRIDIGNYIGDFGKINQLLNWKPVVYLKEGLKKIVEYYLLYKKYYW